MGHLYSIKIVRTSHHKADFGIDTEWHFFATLHGKGPCDGLGGIVKWLAVKASLQQPYKHQIMTPHQLYEYVSANISSDRFQQSRRMRVFSGHSHTNIQTVKQIGALRGAPICFTVWSLGY